jgi:hypothetical protein
MELSSLLSLFPFSLYWMVQVYFFLNVFLNCSDIYVVLSLGDGEGEEKNLQECWYVNLCNPYPSVRQSLFTKSFNLKFGTI